MRNLAAIKTKSNSHYTCQECGSTELIQAHHEIPGDDDSLVALCASCHSKRHPNLAKALFFNKRLQPYWHNKSASSVAKGWDVSSRTVIRTAKQLGIQAGELRSWDEGLIQNNIRKLNSKARQTRLRKEARQIEYELKKKIEEERALKGFKLGDVLSIWKAAAEVGVHFTTLYRWIQAGEVAYVSFGDTVFIPLLEAERLKKKEKNKVAVG